jgi:hypothetical protein
LQAFEKTDKLSEKGIVGTVTFVTMLGLSIEYEVRLDSGAQIKLEMPRSRDQVPVSEGSRVLVTPKDEASFLTISSE